MSRFYDERYDDVYFSQADGLAEKRHVFLSGNNLPARWQNRDDFIIFEAGFGTGLSFSAAAQCFLETTSAHQHLHVISVEAHPLTSAQIRTALAPWVSEIGGMANDMIAALMFLVPGWHRFTLWGRVHLTLIIGDINAALPELNAPIDAWFLDGFTPVKNPAMWSDTLFTQMARLSAHGATAATYSAARVVKDGLARAGFAVTKVKGHGHKGDMLTAVYNGPGQASIVAARGKRIVIRGGGLAACAAAYVLKQSGHAPVIVAPNGLADEASGNPRGLFNPRFAKTFSPMAQFYASAFAAFARLAHVHGTQFDARINGALHLLRDDDAAKKLGALRDVWGWDESIAHEIDANQASHIAGINLIHRAMWLPQSGSVDPRQLCAFYARDVEIRRDAPADGDAQVLAMGAAMRDHPAAAHLPLQTVRGQISLLRPTDLSARLQTNLCYGGYLSPAYQGMHVLGATYQHWLHDTALRDQDHTDLQTKLHGVTGPMFTQDHVMDGRASFRVATPDRAPIIGKLNENTYVSTAHGSHGILSSLMAAHMIADAVSGAPFFGASNIQSCVSPVRFLPKNP